MTAHNGNGRPSPEPELRRPAHGGGRTTGVPDRSGDRSRPAKLWPAAVEATSEARARLASTLSEAEDAAGGVGDATSGPSAAGVVSRLETAAAVLAHCRALIDAAGPACVAVKPQLACFERLGAPGWLALEHVCEHARGRGLLVLADGKRGDVPVTAAAYAQALVDSTPSPFGPVERPRRRRLHRQPAARPRRARAADRHRAQRVRRASFVLVRTSNPGAADILDVELATGERLWERLARLVDELGEPGPSGLSRRRRRHRRHRARAPRAAARADAHDALPAARASAPRAATSPRSRRRSRRAGPAGLVTASRSIANAHQSGGRSRPKPPAPRPSACACRRGRLG